MPQHDESQHDESRRKTSVRPISATCAISSRGAQLALLNQFLKGMAASLSFLGSAVESDEGPMARFGTFQEIRVLLLMCLENMDDFLGVKRVFRGGEYVYIFLLSTALSWRVYYSIFFVFELLEQGGMGCSISSSFFSTLQHEELEEAM
ncbi:hypothetical protein PG997_011886 [Apiospora hydei]|uniref:Uncharacterized protein n=1 Tax=Apiospora hydei TaxID=1337664 RepID=A0ABR1V1S9_9PEZI